MENPHDFAQRARSARPFAVAGDIPILNTAMIEPSRLEAALAYSAQPFASRLQTRMKGCGYDWNGSFACRSPACRRCLNRHVGKERRAATKRFGQFANADLSSVSIVVGATTDILEIETIWAKFRKDLRNIVYTMRRHRNGLWALTEALVWLEVDAVAGEDFVRLPPQKASQLGPMAPIFVQPAQPVWIVTCHGIIAHKSIPVGDVQRRLEERWSGPRQVFLRPFDPANPLAKNIGGVVNYALKHECRTAFKDLQQETWSPAWMADFFASLQGWSRGFQRLRISIGRMGVKKSRWHDVNETGKRTDARPDNHNSSDFVGTNIR